MIPALPDFVVVGAMKAGTTTLYRHLQSHPRIFMPELKEPDFYVTNKNWGRGFEWYASLFRDAPVDALRGEASTNYSKGASFPEVPGRLRAHAPDVKIIYLLRDPIERIRSQYVHSILSGKETRSPAEAITADSGYVDTSLYGSQVQRYLEHFPPEQLLVVLTEDMRDDPAGLLEKVSAFLQIGPFPAPGADRDANVSGERRGSTRLSSALQRSEALQSLSRRLLPDGVRSRVRRGLTREVDTRKIRIPGEVIEPLHGMLAADRALLQQQMPVDVSKWAALPVG